MNHVGGQPLRKSQDGGGHGLRIVIGNIGSSVGCIHDVALAFVTPIQLGEGQAFVAIHIMIVVVVVPPVVLLLILVLVQKRRRVW